MTYYSLQGGKSSKPYSFKEATLLGQSPDGGLFFPMNIPKWDNNFIKNIKQRPSAEVGVEVLKPYVGNDIDPNTLQKIVAETLAFDIPIRPVTEHISTLELFHGPTMAFKDVGARFLSRCLAHFAKDIQREVVVLVATSGDTGGAVADGFSNVAGVKVVILYPSGMVSALQEKQLCSSSPNVHTLEIQGTFDDCQSLVKQAFRDKDLNEKIYLTSANSINIARWLPQQLYYVEAFKRWQGEGLPTLSVPSGNLGNLCAGVLAQRSGLPVHHFIVACNANDVIVEFVADKKPFHPKPAVPTLSNAMDIGSPNNFVRLFALFDNDEETLRKHLSGFRVSDEETLQAIKDVYASHQYLLDPHGAVAYVALSRYMKSKGERTGIFLETAHPIKFSETVEKATGEQMSFADPKIQLIMNKPKQTVLLDKNFSTFKAWLDSGIS